MHAACREAGFPKPAISHDGSGLWIDFRFSATYKHLIEGTVTHKADRQNPEVTPEVAPETRLLRALRAPLSRRSLQEELGLRDDDHFREAFLQPALEAGLIERTIPDKPKSRLQKYRLTAAGHRRLEAGDDGRRKT